MYILNVLLLPVCMNTFNVISLIIITADSYAGEIWHVGMQLEQL